VLAIDPGSHKCGIAVTSAAGEVKCRAIVPTADLIDSVRGLVEQFQPIRVLCGNGTHSASILRGLASTDLGAPLTPVDEAYSSEAARLRYVAENPARGLARLLPRSLRTPPEPYDDYVAIILAERFWKAADPCDAGGGSN
jgi:hypothetical protein